MNNKLLRIALDSGLINCIDHETPRHYFTSGNADLETIEEFAEKFISAVLSDIRSELLYEYSDSDTIDGIISAVKSEYLV